ncbi:tetratricopeptide repeat protein [Rhodopseudomonas sp. P1]|uniref:tetratricopeptide repeat protein n=1 Tax=Rhodopseudomonas sp. P1 TaxID=3434357 RepID=UPI0031FD906A
MDAIYSGQSATLAFLEGAEVRVHRSNIDEFTIAREGLCYLYRGSNDAVFLRGVTEAEAQRQFELSWRKDRALRLTLIAIDPEEAEDLQRDALDCLEELITNDQVVQFIENQLYSRPFPADVELEHILSCPSWPLTAKMLRDALTQQAAIRERREAWDALDASLFDKIEKDIFEEQAILRGAFRILSSTDLTGTNHNVAILECYRILASLPNARSVVSKWTHDFKLESVKLHLIKDNDEDAKTRHEPAARNQLSPFQSFSNVLQQQNAIIEKLRLGSVRLARRYADELVSSQLKQGNHAYAAKSLCKLAQEAKYFGLNSVQLEWALRATDVYPDDPWAHGQAADALLEFSRIDEAIVEIDLCEAKGDAEFAATARARILRYQGRLDEALSAFRAVRDTYRNSERNYFAWFGSAETLREMWKFEDALAEYDAAIQEYPNHVPLLCGRAAVLFDLGRSKDALEAYGDPRCEDNLYARNGKTTVLKETGRLDEAIDFADQSIELFPTDPVSRCLKADILRASGDYLGALQVYAQVKASNPTISVAFSGFAEVLRDMRRLSEAVAAYEEAAELFPNESRIANGRANIRKVNDELAVSLALYEANVRKFPYDLIAKVGRADLLKRLKMDEDAIDAYNQIIKISPNYRSARNGKAAILAALGDYAAADALLPVGLPATRDDWIAWHIRGMILLRKGFYDQAIKHLEHGSNQSTFIRERRYFARALSIAQMRKGEFEKAFKILETTGGGISNVLRLHALAGAGSIDHAKAVYHELSSRCPSRLVALRDAIAAKFGISSEPVHYNDNWIFEAESDELLREAA